MRKTGEKLEKLVKVVDRENKQTTKRDENVFVFVVKKKKT